MILDIHTHHPAPQPYGVVSVRFGADIPDLMPGQLYSIGLHPWDTGLELTADVWQTLEAVASSPQIVAIGESGIDIAAKGAPLFRQLNIFRRHIEMSESLKKPLIIHNVKAHDMIVGLHKELKPSQNWAIHGFRGKPQVATMLLRAGLYLSFGERFNPESLRCMPLDRILAETDESQLDINMIMARISEARGEDISDAIAANSRAFLEHK